MEKNIKKLLNQKTREARYQLVLLTVNLMTKNPINSIFIYSMIM